MNIKIGLIVGFTITFVFLSGCMGGMGISVEKLDYEPDNYIIITNEQMLEYPKIKEAVEILNSDDYNKMIKSLKCNDNEIDEIEALFGEDPDDNVYKGENFFKYQDQYYSLEYYFID